MTLSRLRTPMYKKRMDAYPRIPYTLVDLTRALLQHPRVALTVDGEQSMYAGSTTGADGSHSIVFMSQRSIDLLGRVKTVQADGTFRSRPSVPPSCQCFALVTTYKDCVS